MESEESLDPEDRAAPDLWAQCGDPIDGDVERGFAFGAEYVLCWRCATERGGIYDGDQESWMVPPEVADLIDD